MRKRVYYAYTRRTREFFVFKGRSTSLSFVYTGRIKYIYKYSVDSVSINDVCTSNEMKEIYRCI